MKFKRPDLEKQAKADEERFDGMGPSAKNALVSELKKFWPIAAEMWPTKFLYSETANPAKQTDAKQGQ
jgi:hypothetical protein